MSSPDKGPICFFDPNEPCVDPAKQTTLYESPVTPPPCLNCPKSPGRVALVPHSQIPLVTITAQEARAIRGSRLY